MVDLVLERQLPWKVAASASYLYSKGKKLPRFIDRNLPAANSQIAYVLKTSADDPGTVLGSAPFYRGLPPGVTSGTIVRPDQNIGSAIEVVSDVESTYHAMVLQANKRFSHGFLFNTSYTLSKARDTGQNSTTFIAGNMSVFDPANIAAEEGPSNTDRRHRFVASFHWAPGFLYGVQFGGIFTGESGLPIDATISSGFLTGTGAVVTTASNGAGGSFRAPFEERNGYRQTGRKTFDFRLSKEFNLGGRKRIVALAESFNVFNLVNYTSFSNLKYRPTGNAVYDAATNKVTMTMTENVDFLKPSAASSTIFGPRDAQLGLKFLW